MNVDQVRNVERIANEMIDRNEEIYAKEAPLALAKSIQVDILHYLSTLRFFLRLIYKALTNKHEILILHTCTNNHQPPQKLAF